MSLNDRILIINNSDLLNNFFKDCFKRYKIELILSKTPFDGLIKMKNEIPDLVIIDYQLTLDGRVDFFKEKKDYKTIADIPVICLSSKIDMNAIIKAGKNKVYKFIEKPIKQDLFLETVSKILNKPFEFDNTPSIMEVSLNGDVLFIEIGMGINYEKLNSLKYKIIELMAHYGLKKVKSLVMFNDVQIQDEKLSALISVILDATHSPPSLIKFLSTSSTLKGKLNQNEITKKIEVYNELSAAMDSLGSVDIDSIVNKTNNSTSELSLEDSSLKNSFFSTPKIALIDDDEFVIDLVEASLAPLEVEIIKYTNGNKFIDEISRGNHPDLVFLDLMMPAISGFEILEKLQRMNINLQIIIFSSLSQKETVTKALKYGVKSYIVKPIDPELILKKASELLKSNF